MKVQIMDNERVGKKPKDEVDVFIEQAIKNPKKVLWNQDDESSFIFSF